MVSVHGLGLLLWALIGQTGKWRVSIARTWVLQREHLVGRKFDTHYRPTIWRAKNRHMTAVALNNLPNQVQTKTGPGRARPQAIEWFEHAFSLFRWYAWTIVFYLEYRSQHADRYMTPTMFDRVLHEVGDHPFDRAHVTTD